jgi:hypothetical protein
LVFTLPKQIADIAHQNKREIYNLLMRASADTVIKIAADPKHLGARAGMISVLHTWGSAMTHHPHVHMIVPGGGLSTDGSKWISSRKNFFLSVRVLSRLYRRLILEGLAKLHEAGKLQFFGELTKLDDRGAFDVFLKPLRQIDWVVYAKEPFAGPKSVLAYLSRYTHRVAISNSRLIRFDARSVTFRVKDYRLKGAGRHTTMTLDTAEFIRRFLIHVLPRGQHRIRHYGFYGNSNRAANIAQIRQLLGPKRQIISTPMTPTPTMPITATHPRAAMPVLRRATDHHRHNRASTTPPSTTKTTKGRSMIRAPYITNDTRSRRLYRLRTNHHTLIKLSMWKKLMTSRKYRASRPHVGKADPALSLTGTCNGSVRSYPRQAHSPNLHSNKRPTKPNPAISRLSASPTPGNVPRHSNGAHVASEKPTP